MKKFIHVLSTLILAFTLSATIARVPVLAQDGDTGGSLQADEEVTKQTLQQLNPLSIAGDGSIPATATPADLINRFLIFAFPLAGLILFVMLIWAGFEILAGSASKKSLDAGKQRATAAVIGFLLLFVSYWIAQILEVIFKVTIL